MPLTTCTVNDVEFSVEYTNTKYIPATEFEPPEYPYIHILSIMLEGSEVIELLSGWAIEKIISQIDTYEEDDRLSDYLFEQQREERLFKD